MTRMTSPPEAFRPRPRPRACDPWIDDELCRPSPSRSAGPAPAFSSSVWHFAPTASPVGRAGSPDSASRPARFVRRPARPARVARAVARAAGAAAPLGSPRPRALGLLRARRASRASWRSRKSETSRSKAATGKTHSWPVIASKTVSSWKTSTTSPVATSTSSDSGRPTWGSSSRRAPTLLRIFWTETPASIKRLVAFRATRSLKS